ncbi:hypothetical protein MtrunA17_Chr8g0371071 [Medicago truncatula]|uniref:Uncharacterized protein n=1 Tax=Medicago truncatula TaxID=3880 RepID=A0A396GND2_MEDTR|nr:hypothetical protein MtrunA17_Chr8g0371071 [Medicago truncatula]
MILAWRRICGFIHLGLEDVIGLKVNLISSLIYVVIPTVKSFYKRNSDLISHMVPHHFQLGKIILVFRKAITKQH